MNTHHFRYVLDANVLMTAHHHYYAPDLCPGFWQCLSHYFHSSQLLVIDRVRDEILSPPELLRWVEQDLGGLFLSTTTQPVINAYGQMMEWVRENNQFMPAALSEFARVADGWLAAYSKVNGAVVVTNEVFDPNVRRRVPLPNLCEQFHVRYINTYEMLRELGTRFAWQ